MALPGLSITLQDGNLGLTQPNARSLLLLGICSRGIPNTLYSFSTIPKLQATLGSGPLVQQAAYVLSNAGGIVYCMPLEFTISDSATYRSTILHTGSGSNSCNVIAEPLDPITITMVDATHWTYHVGSGPESAAVLLDTNDHLISGSLTQVKFSSGSGGVQGDVYVIDTAGAVTHTGTGTPTMTNASLPPDTYNLLLTCTTGGVSGTAQFTISLDGGKSTSLPLVTGNATVVPNAGLVVVMNTGTYVKGDTFYGVMKCPGPTSTPITNAMTAFIANNLSTPIFGVSVVGTPESATAAQTMAAALDTQLLSLENTYKKYLRGLAECPTVGPVSGTSGSIVLDGSNVASIDALSSDTDATLGGVSGAFANFTSPRVGVAAGCADIVSGLDGIMYRRNASWPAAAALAAVNAGTDASAVRLGSEPGLTFLYRDEFLTPALDNARFITLRTYPQLPGFYLTNVSTMALSTSDYHRYANARVVDAAASITVAQAQQLINASVPTKPNGTIQEKAAKLIEKEITAALQANLVKSQPQDAVDAKCTVDRSNNVLSTSTLNLTISILPFGYASFINATIGFQIQ